MPIDNAVVLFVILVTYAIGTLIFKHYTPKIKGARGEFRVSRRLRRLDKKKYKIYNDIYLKVDDRITQIDHLIISIYGIFVIETKNYRGWIHGGEKSEYWSQTFYKKKTKFRNPIKQNWAHIYLLKDALSDFKQITYHSLIVFTGKGKLKNVYSTVPVIYKKELLKTIRQESIPNISIEQVEEISDKINGLLIHKKKGKKEHRKYVKKSIKDRKKKIKASICPNCGGKLELRKGPYGKFYGCSNYPKCRFSTKFR